MIIKNEKCKTPLHSVACIAAGQLQYDLDSIMAVFPPHFSDLSFVVFHLIHPLPSSHNLLNTTLPHIIIFFTMRFRFRSIYVSIAGFGLLSLSLHFLAILDGKVENDISRYIQQQSSLIPSVQKISTKPGYPLGKEDNSTRKAPPHSGMSEVEDSMKHDDGFKTAEEDNPSLPHLYWNLSCPMELSMFSGAHMGGDFLERAQKAKILARSALSAFETVDWSALENRRIFFVGDSLLRQVFISIACLNWDMVENYAVPWFEKRGVRTRHPNTIGSGPHSKFEEARVLLKGNVELVFHHGIGGLLELGKEYQSHDPDLWIKNCYTKKPLTTVTLAFPESNNHGDMSTLQVTREKLVLKSSDVVVINSSVHRERLFNLNNIFDLLLCRKQMKYDEGSWPTLLYVMTGASHFPTETGAFEEDLLGREDDFGCKTESSFRGYQHDELQKLQGHLPILGKEILDIEYSQGGLHVGGKDCLHWLQPGIPDLLAADVTSFIATLSANMTRMK